jgi:nicotinate-nucleotide pyrophosphorylase (carboxylating)
MQERDYLPLIDMALAEDLGEIGDVTTEPLDDYAAEARLLAKADGILAGLPVFAAVFTRIDPGVSVRPKRHDGDAVARGEVVAEVSGPVKSILKAERTSLNLLSYLSGIATETRRFVQAASGSLTVLDTRKTLPGYRALAKEAVRIGGGSNHRMGLHDMVLIKDNHVDSAGSVSRAVKLVRERWGSRFPVEVECRTLPEVEEAAKSGVDIVMLDNMDAGLVRDAVKLIHGRARTEASGNMTVERVRELRDSGVDSVSVGRLTHSVEALDFSLKIRPRGARDPWTSEGKQT